MTEDEQQRDEREEFEREETEVLQRDQEHKGYGEDEGERDGSFPQRGRDE
jgi:hypothetical protein